MTKMNDGITKYWDWQGSLEIISSNLPSQPRSFRANYSGPCPAEFSISPREELFHKCLLIVLSSFSETL